MRPFSHSRNKKVQIGKRFFLSIVIWFGKRGFSSLLFPFRLDYCAERLKKSCVALGGGGGLGDLHF